MYLDNVIKSAQVAAMPQITYSEIVEDSLHMVEVEGAGQMALLKAEASAHILGSEAPSDWWVKIKTVARKIFEMLKNLITKVFAYIKAVPTKVGSLITRLLTQWEKVGMKSKIDRINKKTGIKVRFASAQDVKGRDFGPIFGSINGFPSHGGAVRNALDAWAAATVTAMDNIGNINKEDNDKLEEQIQAEKETVITAENKYKDKVEEFKRTEYKPFDSIFPTGGNVDDNTAVPPGVLTLITNGWNALKNKVCEKNAVTAMSNCEKGTRSAAKNYRLAMAAYERCTRDEDENGVRNALERAKQLRAMITTCGRQAAVYGSLNYKDALTIAKIVNAGISCCKGGETKSTKSYT